MKLAKYIAAWIAINVTLCILWAVLGVPPEFSFLLGMVHGSASQMWLFGKYTKVW